MANIGKYHVHSLTELLPQKDYAETFDRNMFFVYMKNAETVNPEIEKEWYEEIRKIFLDSADRLTKLGKETFTSAYGKDGERWCEGVKLDKSNQIKW